MNQLKVVLLVSLLVSCGSGGGGSGGNQPPSDTTSPPPTDILNTDQWIGGSDIAEGKTDISKPSEKKIGIKKSKGETAKKNASGIHENADGNVSPEPPLVVKWFALFEEADTIFETSGDIDEDGKEETVYVFSSGKGGWIFIWKIGESEDEDCDGLYAYVQTDQSFETLEELGALDQCTLLACKPEAVDEDGDIVDLSKCLCGKFTDNELEVQQCG